MCRVGSAGVEVDIDQRLSDERVSGWDDDNAGSVQWLTICKYD